MKLWSGLTILNEYKQNYAFEQTTYFGASKHGLLQIGFKILITRLFVIVASWKGQFPFKYFKILIPKINPT